MPRMSAFDIKCEQRVGWRQQMASCAMRVVRVSVMGPRGGGAHEASRASTRARAGRSAWGRPYPVSPVVTLRTLRAAPQPRANAGGNRAAPSRLRAVGANAAEAEERLDTEEEFGTEPSPQAPPDEIHPCRPTLVFEP